MVSVQRGTADLDEPFSYKFDFFAGEYRLALPLWEDLAARAERQGQIPAILLSWAQVARCHNALGNFDDARAAYRKGREAGSRLKNHIRAGYTTRHCKG